MDNSKREVKTYTAIIYIGFKEGDTGIVHTLNEARQICQSYVNNIGLCITLTPTEYIYTNGNEPGCIIGLINYPRFPDTIENIRQKSIDLAYIFLREFNQYRITIVMPDKTIMVSNNEIS